MIAQQQRIDAKRWSLLVAKAWADEELRARLLANPKAVLQEHGIEVDPEVRVKIHQDTDEVVHLTLPVSPSGDLSEEELSPVAGTDSFSGGCGRCGRCGCGCGCGCGCRGCDAF